MIGWYFAQKNKKLRYGDGREIRIGETHEVEGPLELCTRGLHASTFALDALQYAPGPILYRVELSGEILCGYDKSCATRRTYLSGGVDASDILRQFARECALSVVHLWDAPKIVIDYLKTGDESIRALAWDAAWAAESAADAAARDAAGAAARAAASAAGAAARAAAWAAESAADAAARAAAWDAAWDAAREKQKERLETMAKELIGGINGQ